MARRLPRWRALSPADFSDPRWQLKQAATGLEGAATVAREMAGPAFADAVRAGAARSAMSVRVTPHLLSLIDWERPVDDPIRRQFLPLADELRPDHPHIGLDPLAERLDSPVPGLVHRYRDRALFLSLDTCPVYCSFCTRSYVVGAAADAAKDSLPISPQRWESGLAYLRRTPAIKDVVVSGGDTWLLAPRHLRRLLGELCAIPHVTRVRLGTRGLAALPTRATTDAEWLTALRDCAHDLRRAGKRLMMHTHFNHANEVSAESCEALDRLRELPLELRNHTVLLAGVNDAPEALTTLFTALSDAGSQPYYAFQPDLVPRAEHLRISLQTGMNLERAVAGTTSGYDLPRFVVDLPGGGGKRNPWSFDTYDRETGVAVYSRSSVKEGSFVHVDPLHTLEPEMAARWVRGEVVVDDAVHPAGT